MHGTNTQFNTFFGSGNGGPTGTTSSLDGTGITVVDDFTGSASNGAITTAASLVFESGWGVVQISGGTQSIAGAPSTYQNPGIARLQTLSATSGQGVVMYKGGGVNSSTNFGILGANTGWQQDWYFRTGSSLATLCYRLGCCSTNQQTVDNPTNGFWIEYDTANASSATTFQIRTENASTAVYTNTGITPAISTWYHVRFSSATSGTLTYQLGVAGGVLSAPVNITSNVNTTLEMNPMMQVIARGAVTAVLDVDRFSHVAPTARG